VGLTTARSKKIRTWSAVRRGSRSKKDKAFDAGVVEIVRARKMAKTSNNKNNEKKKKKVNVRESRKAKGKSNRETRSDPFQVGGKRQLN